MNDQEINQLTQQLAVLEKMAKKVMSKEAIQRYGNVKLAHPETAIKAITVIAQAAQMGQINQTLSDQDFKAILLEIQRGKRTFNFRR
ncbi:MAG: hypothetical protein JSW08_00720 [archaeon]|nr:MAG: hypothetical protein JSW08_00720 [archaeon]